LARFFGRHVSIGVYRLIVWRNGRISGSIDAPTSQAWSYGSWTGGTARPEVRQYGIFTAGQNSFADGVRIQVVGIYFFNEDIKN